LLLSVLVCVIRRIRVQRRSAAIRVLPSERPVPPSVSSLAIKSTPLRRARPPWIILRMLRWMLPAAALLLVPSTASATWSVIAVDRSTGRVVIASATCVANNDEFLKGIQAVVVPGKGVAACQAGVDSTHKNQMLVFEELKKGTDPARIIELLSEDPAFQSR